MPDPTEYPKPPSPEDEDLRPQASAMADDSDADIETDVEAEDDGTEGTASNSPLSGTTSSSTSSNASGSTSSSTSGGTARGIDEHAIEKWTPEQQKVFNSVKDKVQELGIAKDDVQRIAAFSVLQFIAEKDRKPDTRVDRVQAVNANGDTIVRMENMKYGDREPIFTNDVRMKDAPAFDQSAAQIEQANQRLQGKSAEQNIAMQQQNQDNNQRERMNALQATEDQIMARVQSSNSAIRR
ncbi:MAG: hypothetical protein J0M09_10480 [Xanthomonadales bacterium]|nr:hypothetical protein [Xanthomonadales bacterium]